MGKLLIFALLWRLTGNPLLALLVVVIVLYFLDRRFIGLTPNVLKPLQRMRRLSRLREELRLNPHHTSVKLEMARLEMERKKYAEAEKLLRQTAEVMEDSAEVLAELGICELKLGRLDEGERHILEAAHRNPRVKYGEPFLRLGEAYAEKDPAKAVAYLRRFGEVNSSSCEAYYRLGGLYKRLGQQEEASRAFRETTQLYRSLPKYKRRQERRYALLARFK
ncbi:tetratricopeptide repeat protein [Paenibacillus filicis]|uniref:Tetratricopeptide repeat protein n=1 Tax=Paenibacillus gyeongsangnamensis TaxID=3388067 RepID=A0ABT4Q554_9BACL|nr:tetratricopeptide repeat protein [Paenibacillus filicis]MCZ8511997.1 tetratricopeptide repeat protein [Paenibacillus filicis]